MTTIQQLATDVVKLEGEAAKAHKQASSLHNEGLWLEQQAFNRRVEHLESLGYVFDFEGDCISVAFKGKQVSRDTGGHDGEEFMVREALRHAGLLKQWDSAVKQAV